MTWHTLMLGKDDSWRRNDYSIALMSLASMTPLGSWCWQRKDFASFAGDGPSKVAPSTCRLSTWQVNSDTGNTKRWQQSTWPERKGWCELLTLLKRYNEHVKNPQTFRVTPLCSFSADSIALNPPGFRCFPLHGTNLFAP